jgi:polyhydroxyalkanoic acid synthase PhaR subunit
MSNESKSGGQVDPFALWRQMFAVNEEAFSTALNQLVNTENYASSMGKYMENMVAFQKTLQDNMEKFLHMNGLPTRSDFARLSSQIVDIDERLDDLQVKMEESSAFQNLKKDLENLSAQLGRIESAVETIHASLSQPKQAIAPVSEPVPATGDFYPLGEASPVNKKAPKRKPLQSDTGAEKTAQ